MKIHFWLDYETPVVGHTAQSNLLKLATVTRESWRRNGWTPEILRARDAENKLHLRGKLLAVGERCPAWMYDFLPALYEKGGGWLTEADVFNNGFEPQDALAVEAESVGRIISLKAGFGFGAIFLPHKLIPDLIQAVIGMDAGLITTRSEFPNIESFLRERQTAIGYDVIGFPFCEPDWQRRPLWHLTSPAIKNFV